MENKGRSGSGNETIARAVINSAMRYRIIDQFYIMWSASDRYEVVTLDKGVDELGDRVTYRVWDDDFRWSTWYGGHRLPGAIKYYRRHFWNEQHQYYRTLEAIHRTQMFLDKKKIPYTMMIFNKHVLRNTFHSESERALYNQIDWTKFLFYKDKEGLWEFAEDNYKEYYLPGESHPPPIAHYHWVKDIMFQSDILCPEDEYNKLKNYFEAKNG
tara:strand:- start:550 stop:1188 length:639 start_codon:yes stop_codon:yes gene_type:complete